MALLPILQAPHPILKTRAEPVAAIDDDLRRLVADMLETMYKAPGIGLAAPQVGVLKRLVVVDVAEGEERRPMALVNPEILWRSDTLATAEEGCLSLPGQFADVTRPEAIRLRYATEHGEEREIEADGLLARCIQHEIDHLDGILFVDHLSALRRNMIMRKLAKRRQQRA
ncbi:peptide deformylase [Benzoatithermus flavus]|uniref:Peptide deformylase n=1 Tax=Benzoatithermus flavus TaxID=3108223 RepID=A0ABU8XMU6_9PROT